MNNPAFFGILLYSDMSFILHSVSMADSVNINSFQMQVCWLCGEHFIRIFEKFHKPLLWFMTGIHNCSVPWIPNHTTVKWRRDNCITVAPLIYKLWVPTNTITIPKIHFCYTKDSGKGKSTKQRTDTYVLLSNAFIALATSFSSGLCSNNVYIQPNLPQMCDAT